MSLFFAPASLSRVSATPKEVVPCSEDAALGIRPCWELEAGRVGVFTPGKGAKATKGFRSLPQVLEGQSPNVDRCLQSQVEGPGPRGSVRAPSSDRPLWAPSASASRWGRQHRTRLPVPDACTLPMSSLSTQRLFGPSGSGLLETRARSIH